MYYALALSLAGRLPERIFGNLLQGRPYIFDFTTANPKAGNYVTDNFDTLQEQIFTEMREAGHQWGIGRYLEDRSPILSAYPQMLEEERVFHAGLDVVVPEGTEVFAPLEAVVYKTGVDEGLGNYGGYVILEHLVEGLRFYSFYGHLDTRFRIKARQRLSAGDGFATIGARMDSGGWFTHVHLQILTETAIDEDRYTQGYVCRYDLPRINDLFPSPYPLFRA